MKFLIGEVGEMFNHELANYDFTHAINFAIFAHDGQYITERDNDMSRTKMIPFVGDVVVSIERVKENDEYNEFYKIIFESGNHVIVQCPKINAYDELVSFDECKGWKSDPNNPEGYRVHI